MALNSCWINISFKSHWQTKTLKFSAITWNVLYLWSEYLSTMMQVCCHNKTCGNTTSQPKGTCHSNRPPCSKPISHTVCLRAGNNSMVPHSTTTAVTETKKTHSVLTLNKTFSWKMVKTAVKSHREKCSIKTSLNTVTAMVAASLSLPLLGYHYPLNFIHPGSV